MHTRSFRVALGVAILSSFSLPGGIRTVRAAAFQNLDFEQATIQTAPPGYVPGEAMYPITSAAALPHWAVKVGDITCNAVWGMPIAMDQTSVALVQTGASPGGSFRYTAIQGQFNVQIYAAAVMPESYPTASISQTGCVPSNAKSIRFLVYVWGGGAKVFLNGVPIGVFPQSSSNGITTMVGDVSAFAGTTAELTFQATGVYKRPLDNSCESCFQLDAISFSPLDAPEPTSLALFTCGAIGMLFHRWKFKIGEGVFAR